MSAAKAGGRIKTGKAIAVGDGTAIAKAGAPKPKKQSCFQCYKLFVLPDQTKVIKKNEKMFCSDFCSKKFEIINTAHCALKECGQPF